MKISILKNDPRLGRDGFGNYVILVLKSGHRVFRVCNLLNIASKWFVEECGCHPLYLCDQHGWRTSNHPNDMTESDLQILDFALAYLRLNNRL